MEQDLLIAHKYFEKINADSADNLLSGNDLEISAGGNIEIKYAPFDYIERSARVVLVGITPGFSQAKLALNALNTAKLSHKPFMECLKTAKNAASFGGRMRPNLIELLDYVGVAQKLNIPTTALLFEKNSKHAHFTSALRYPVFINKKNYSGAPDMLKTPILKSLVDTCLAEEAKILKNAIWVPLGEKPQIALMYLTEKGILPKKNILIGMPHPSGANAERIAIFTGRKKPEDASSKTNSEKLLCAAKEIKEKILQLKS